MKFFIYDTETTGLARKDEVIQFSGFLLNDKFQKEKIINFYAYTNVEIISKAQETHNIDKKLLWELSKGKTFEEQIYNYRFLFEEPDIMFVGYNVTFDNRLVNQTLANNGFSPVNFGKPSKTLAKQNGRYYFDLMKPLSSMLNRGISMKLSAATEHLKKRNIAEVNKIYDVIFERFGIVSGMDDAVEISKFHNALYDSFLCWCLTLDYKSEINCLFR